jgi:hypothetical protein
MTREDLSRLVSAEIDDARSYLSERTGNSVTTSAPMGYNMAHKFMRGEVDIPAEDGKSQVTSRDLSDVLGWVMPGLLRVFLASDRVVQYEPNKPKLVQGPPAQDQQGNVMPGPPKDIAKDLADQATDYVNYSFLTDCGGYNVLQSAIYDGLLLGNGLIKHWWDGTPEWEIEGPFTGLSDEQFALLVNGDDVEVIEHTARAAFDAPPMVGGEHPPYGGALPADAGGPQPAAGPGGWTLPVRKRRPLASAGIGSPIPGPALLHDCKIRRRVSEGRLRVDALPPEQFLIERNARRLDESVRFCAHAFQETRSRLVERASTPSRSTSLPARPTTWTSRAPWTAGAIRRGSAGPVTTDRATELVDVFECYCLADYDGDGVAERYKVIMAGGIGERQMLHAEPWPDELPFSDLVPDPVPHRWRGHSLFDELYDIVRIKTALLRQTQDNLYQSTTR